jgi:tRNA (guanine37-N1)-methyltransferase
VDESHGNGLLEHRQYTKPNAYEGWQVPPVLLSGNHRNITRAQRKDALLLTERLRPDLAARMTKTRDDEKILADARVPTLEPVPSPAEEPES